MKISCPACAAKYSIADEKVQERLAKIRCRKCGTTIVIDGKVHPPHVYAADASSGDHPHVSGHSMGGDSCNGVGVHDTWDQVFIVTAGSGTLISGRERIPIDAGCIAFIPKGTPHDVETTADQAIDYYYVNVYDSAEHKE